MYHNNGIFTALILFTKIHMYIFDTKNSLTIQTQIEHLNNIIVYIHLHIK